MENASKALIIAASVILGVLLFSLMIMMFRRAALVDQHYESNQSARTLELNNSYYEKYNNNTNTILDLISLCNLAYSNNVECYYDENKAVRIEIKVSNSAQGTFVIPNRLDQNYGSLMFDSGASPMPVTAYRAQELSQSIIPTDYGYGKNRIWRESNKSNPISIYDLASKSLNELGVSSSNDKLSKTHYGMINYKYTDRFGEEQSATENITTYKYYFKCEGVTYHQVTGTIESMTFKYVDNGKNEFQYGEESQYYWHPEWD